jgi:arylsulfatase A-like enzyme
MNVIVILLDSLNKQYLSCYGNDWISTPSIQRLADRGLIFERHYIGSAPCMPARRELFTGRKEFMWRGWGQIEPFDDFLQVEAKKAGAYTAAITDHYHFWDASHGYGYLQKFDYTDMIRGTEADSAGHDPFDKSQLPEWVKSIAKYRDIRLASKFYNNVKAFRDEEEFQSPRVMSAAARWLDNNAERDKFLLYIDSFDPHEPWYLPEPYRSMYGPYGEEYTCWPPYQQKDESEKFRNEASAAEIDFIRRQYAGNITMADTHLRKLFDVMDRKDLWKKTMVILTSDHGHEMYEKGRYGKGYPHWNTSSNIPLIVWHPDFPGKGRRTDAFSTTVDLNATILDALGCERIPAPNGKSQFPVLAGQRDSVRDGVLYGSFGTGACLTNTEYTFVCGYDNRKPIYWYSTMLNNYRNSLRIEDAVGGKFIPGVPIPVWKVPRKRNIGLVGPQQDLLFRLEDWEQIRNIADSDPEGLQRCREQVIKLMEEEQVPEEQYVRLGLRDGGCE